METARSRRCDRRTRGTAADASRKHAVQLTLAAASAVASRNMASSHTDSPGKYSLRHYRPQMLLPLSNRPSHDPSIVRWAGTGFYVVHYLLFEN